MRLTKNLAAIGAVTVLCLLGSIPPAMAQMGITSQKQLDVAAARAERKAIVGQNMSLTADESKAFWPLYDEYETRTDKIEDRHVKEVKDFVENYQTLTDDDATRKLDEVINITQDRLDVQKAYIPKFRAALSSIKVTRFFQIDNKLHAMVQCNLAQMIPLAQPPNNEPSRSSF
jgi:hypothetical protein